MPNPDKPADSSAVILVVERDPHVRELEGYFLERAGYQVEFAGDGMAALELVREKRPNLVITEVLVPRLDGLSVCRRVKEEMPATVVLVFSILAVSGRARDAGADAFLLKPLAEASLVETVRELLSQREEGR